MTCKQSESSSSSYVHSVVDAVGEQLRHLVVGRISAAPFGDVVDTLLQEHLPPLRSFLLLSNVNAFELNAIAVQSA